MKLSISHLQKTSRIGGFTLIETLVAVMILAFAIVGPLTLAAQSLRASHDARDELFATYLATEGIEVIHSIRDNNSGDDLTVNHSNWLQNITSAGRCTPNCAVDIPQQQSPNVWKPVALVSCASVNSVCAKIYYNPTTGLYRQGFAAAPGAPWQPTLYARLLNVVVVNAQRQVRLVSTVTYLGYGHKTRTLTLTDDLYNWFPPLQ